MKTKDEEATLRSPQNGKRLARIVLNGYNIDPNQNVGHIRSFYMRQGDLVEAWSNFEQLLLCGHNGKAVPVRLAALPEDDDSLGLIEFLS